MTMAVYNPGMLPSQGVHDLALPLRSYLSSLRFELNILDGIRTGPLDLPTTLENELDSARYHLATMVAMIELQLRRSGADFGAQALEAPAIKPALDRYLSSLLRAKGLWNAWLEGSPLSFGGFGADGTAVPSNIDETEQTALDVGKAAASPPISKTMLTLGIGLGIAGLIYVMRR